MKVEHTIAAVRAALKQARQKGQSIAFVPTMGNLHSGHIQLINEARRRADYVVASIFVNPTQFGAGEDFDNYPRTLDADSAQLADAKCDLLFAPSATEMYPDGRSQLTTVSVAGITETLCGASRPGHFTGVATVVTKLFNIIQPDMALFGEKDYQQLAVIRCMAKELCIPIEIIGIPTVRAENGLALSSRNGYLSAEARTKAPMLYNTLCQVRDALLAGQDDVDMLTKAASAHLNKCGFDVDYLVAYSDKLQPLQAENDVVAILVAAKLDGTRLIDNLSFQRKVTK
ncbi:MAG: pantoate--beta-alanine ligase [Moraxellaceae bacterium]|nr:pantoate--beta-alanine ligase [Moraxellaceae bacterium]MDZ4387474.1 pantoate--beta-alanine ligase [Moraxellaceae bacterium]